MTESDTFGAFIETIYEETLALLVDTREFLTAFPAPKNTDPANPGAAAPGDAASKGRSETVSAISHLTWRMTELMSWLMMQKAIFAGEIDLAQAATQPAFKLSDIEIDETRPDSPYADLPVAVRGLIDRGRRIGDRATRLHDSLEKSRAG
jgi:regulator of CtrA degradation